MHRHFPYATGATALLTVTALWVVLFALADVPDPDIRTSVFLVVMAVLSLALWIVTGRLEAAERHAEGLAQEQRDFANVVTHELRLPLSQSRWAVDIAYEDSGMGEEARRALADSKVALAGATTLLADLTLISRLDRGVQPIDIREHVPLQDVIRAVMERFDGPEFRSVRFDVGTIPAAEVVADRRLLIDGVSAFVTAFTEFGKAGGYVAIDVSVFANKQMCEIRISDGGTGIPDQLFSLLSDPHRRYASDDRTFGRVGIGMYAAKRGLQATRCGVTVEQAPEETSYTIRVPLHVTEPLQRPLAH